MKKRDEQAPLRRYFPFSAVIGQDDIKKALIWNQINHSIGGVLISGQKGTAKSTLVRAFAALSEDFGLVELPLNTTEDMLLGGIDFEHAVKHGQRQQFLGLLQRANGKMLYVDEVNLLSDHLVSALLDTAATGVCRVEREGISSCSPAVFMLVGSMNPEEGSLRPQFLDRFGLYVEAKGEEDLYKRSEIIRRRIEFERDPEFFCAHYQDDDAALVRQIRAARRALKNVEVTENAMRAAASLARDSNCAGHRAEVVLIETARTIAALDGRIVINLTDLREAARFALPHRMREQHVSLPQNKPQEDRNTDESDDSPESDSPLEQLEPEKDNRDEASEQAGSPDDSRREVPASNTVERSRDSGNNTELDGSDESSDEDSSQDTGTGSEDDFIERADDLFAVINWLPERERMRKGRGSGKRSRVRSSIKQGRYVKHRRAPKGVVEDLALDATLRAASVHQRYRQKGKLAFAIRRDDLRIKIREKRTGYTLVFVVDASGSMGANKRMKAVKSAILSLLNDAYQKRDKVGLIAFRKQEAEELLGITRSVELAQKRLADLPTGGRTPLAEGLDLAHQIIRAQRIKDREMIPVLILVSDGKATYSRQGNNPLQQRSAARRIRADGIRTVVIDADESYIKLRLSERIAEALDADLYTVDELRAEHLLAAVRSSISMQEAK